VSSISSVGKVAYSYDEATDTWFPIAGSTNTSAAFAWTGAHSFSVTPRFLSNIHAIAGLNNFQNAAARDAAIPTPNNGNICLLREDSLGLPVYQIQYYFNGAWRKYGENVNLKRITNNYTATLLDAGRSIEMDNSNAVTLTIPLAADVPFIVGTQIDIIRSGNGVVTIAGQGGVTIQSKGGTTPDIAVPYGTAKAVKRDTNTWYVFGDVS
jgi:hypothetical protein